MRDRCLCKNMQKVVSEFGVQINMSVGHSLGIRHTIILQKTRKL